MFWPVARLLSGGTVRPVRQHISSLCIDFPPCCVRRLVRGCPRQPVWRGGTWGSGRGRRFLAIAEPRAARRPSVSVLASLRVQDGDDT
jgi:hypothetical protein